MSNAHQNISWSEWFPLASAPSNPIIPRTPGLYRVRRIGEVDLDYIGQTGMRLGQRLAMLKGIYSAEMPYRDPHTAAPALWALRHASGCDFEVSVTPVEGSTPYRKGLEALAISLYRQETGKSPTAEFGRVPSGYRASSPNNSRLVRLGTRFRGGAEPGIILDAHTPGIPPVGKLAGPPQGINWCGHEWSNWSPLSTAVLRESPSGVGLYRIRGNHTEKLLYVGQGKIPDRPTAHLAKLHIADHLQGLIFKTQERLEWSCVFSSKWLANHRLELENDLIAAHIIETGEIPCAQFLG